MKKQPIKNPAIKNPANAFLPQPQTEEPAEAPQEQPEEVKAQPAARITKAPKGYKINPEFLEVKSQRVQLVLQPSVVKRLKKAAAKRKLSMNETANTAIIEFLEKEGF